MKSSDCIKKYDVLYAWCNDCEEKEACPFVAHETDVVVNDLKLSDIGIVDIAQYCFALERNIIGNVLTLGKIWTYLKESKRYKEYGKHIETFEDYIKEMKRSRSTIYNYMRLYQTFGNILEGDLLQIEQRRLLKLAHICKGKDIKEIAEIIHDACEQTHDDFEQECRNLKGKLDCEHPDMQPASFCPECGRFFKQ